MTDANLGSLTKWLRILGYDTVYWRGNADREFLKKAQKEDRIVLTRKRALAERQFSGRLLFLETDLAKSQLQEVLRALSLQPDPDRMFTICSKCNELLAEVEKDTIEGLVPAYIFSQHTRFRFCPDCKSIYWPGSHKNRALEFFKRIGS